MTDRGLVRETNEDYYSILSGLPGIDAAFIIADGMGGHNSGEVASRIAVEFVTERLNSDSESIAYNLNNPGIIENLLIEANNKVYGKSLENAVDRGMGTTMILAVIAKEMMHVAHVGDSRLYLIRNGEITKITTDHSYIEELVKSGSITREQAEKHPHKHLITRALGIPGDIEVDKYELNIMEEDCFVLCTDGLTNMISEEEIKRIALGETPENACRKLIEAANRNGGEDNVTVIVIKI